jgi:ribosomal-protein-serine acetyltransferase
MKKSPLPEMILTSKVILRKHILELAEKMYQAVDSDRERLGRFLPWVPSMQSIEDQEKYIKYTHRNWETREEFDYSIFKTSDDTYLGNIGVHTIRWEHAYCSLGYWIVREHEGQGYLSSALHGLEKACFETGFHRIEIQCSSENQKSCQVPERNGYTLEARLKENRFENGHFVDTFVFAKIDSKA